MGWTNTIIVLEGGKRPSSAVGVRPSSNALMQLLQSSNPLASIIRLNSGLSSLGLSDISAIFKCGQFFSKEMKEARSVFTPVWWEKVTEPIVQCSTATGFVESKLVHIKHAVDRSKFVAIMKDLTREKIDTVNDIFYIIYLVIIAIIYNDTLFLFIIRNVSLIVSLIVN